MESRLGDGLKKIILMGIGAAAMTAEKSQQIVDELVKKRNSIRSSREM